MTSTVAAPMSGTRSPAAGRTSYGNTCGTYPIGARVNDRNNRACGPIAILNTRSAAPSHARPAAVNRFNPPHASPSQYTTAAPRAAPTTARTSPSPVPNACGDCTNTTSGRTSRTTPTIDRTAPSHPNRPANSRGANGTCTNNPSPPTGGRHGRSR
ncbi:hypothetical protein ACFQ1I_09835 [Kitasatospora arboriphila]